MTGDRAGIPRFLIAAPASGCGKTVIVCGLLRAFQDRGMACVSFKCGPDYIDPMFHRQVLGVPGYNLDSFFLEREQVRELFLEKSSGAELSVIEGVMGYYDGVAGISTQASAYDIACITDTPVILVLDTKKSSLSLAAQLDGFLKYREDSRICGVILNRAAPAVAERLKPYLEELGVRVLGAVPECEEAEFESRHLGLTLPAEQKRLSEKTGEFAKILEQNLDLDGILKLAAHASKWEAGEETSVPERKRPDVRLCGPDGHPYRVGVAMDEAFCFYYQENLDFLERAGCELVFFSPIRDRCLPKRLSALLLGGGYPELHAKELSGNEAMLTEIRSAAKSGVKILAECGGFLYLHRTLEGEDGHVYPMAGLICADAFRTEKLSRFGYVELCGGGGTVRGHEFHYWDSTDPGSAMEARKPLSGRNWRCMYAKSGMLAGFPHLYYPSAPELFWRFLAGEVDER